MTMWNSIFSIIFPRKHHGIDHQEQTHDRLTFSLEHNQQFSLHHLQQHRIIVAMINHDRNNILIDSSQANRVNYNVAYWLNLPARRDDFRIEQLTISELTVAFRMIIFCSCFVRLFNWMWNDGNKKKTNSFRPIGIHWSENESFLIGIGYYMYDENEIILGRNFLVTHGQIRIRNCLR